MLISCLTDSKIHVAKCTLQLTNTLFLRRIMCFCNYEYFVFDVAQLVELYYLISYLISLLACVSRVNKLPSNNNRRAKAGSDT